MLESLRQVRFHETLFWQSRHSQMGYVFYGLIGLTQILCLIHCVRNQRDYRWVWIILLFPVIGGGLYLIMEVLPPLNMHSSANTLSETVVRKMMPTRELQRLREDLQFSNTIANREKLADECVRCGFLDEAIELYRQCLEGSNQNTAILLKLAQTYFDKMDFQSAEQTLKSIMSLNPNYRPPVIKLLLARCYENMDQTEQARLAYESALQAHSDMEIKCFYGLFLRKIGDTAKAREVFDNILALARRQPHHAQKMNRPWIQMAKKVSKAL